jgi:hypothetical protein
MIPVRRAARWWPGAGSIAPPRSRGTPCSTLLAARLKWPRPLPLIAGTLVHPSLRAGGHRPYPANVDWTLSCCVAYGRAAAQACDLFAAETLQLKVGDALRAAIADVQQLAASAQAAPFAAAQAARVVVAQRPDAEILALWLADAETRSSQKLIAVAPRLRARHGMAGSRTKFNYAQEMISRSQLESMPPLHIREQKSALRIACHKPHAALQRLNMLG